MWERSDLSAAVVNVPGDALVSASVSIATQVATLLPILPIGVDLPLPTPIPSTSAEEESFVIVTMLDSLSATMVSMTTTGPDLAVPTDIASAMMAAEGMVEGSGSECRLLGPFALFVQLGLGALALLALVYKRWRERPQRPVKIWFFDASKQVFGSVLVHIANVFMSMLTSGRFSIKLDPAAAAEGVVQAGGRLLARGDGDDSYVPNPCSWYLLNLAVDTTLGIPILIFLLRAFTALVSYTPLGHPPESIQSGNYGRPPNAWWWLKQSIIYFCGLFGMKICVLIIFLVFPWISRVGDWALSWTDGNEQLQIVFAMMLFPLIMNALQYYIIDSFIKGKLTGNGDEEGEEGENGHGPDGGRPGGSRRGRRSSIYEAISSDESVLEDWSLTDEEDIASKKSPRATPSPRAREYDPEVDGEDQTVIGSSSSGQPNRNTLVPDELLPKE